MFYPGSDHFLVPDPNIFFLLLMKVLVKKIRDPEKKIHFGSGSRIHGVKKTDPGSGSATLI
jgi:hypothetical protein